MAVDYFHIVFIFQLFFYLAAGFSKLTVCVHAKPYRLKIIDTDRLRSSLAFYRRIFPLASFRIAWIIMTSIVTCFLVASVLTVIFEWCESSPEAFSTGMLTFQ